MDVSFFGEMAWKSALISGFALALAYVLRSRAAADRALVLRLGVFMLLLLPIIAVALPALKIEAWAAPALAPASAPLSAHAPAPMPMPEPVLPALARPAPGLYHAISAGAAPQSAAPQPAAPQPGPTIWDDPTPLVLLAYLGGLLMVGSRLLAGLVLLGRWTRRARPTTCPAWLDAFERARLAAPNGERLRLLVSDSVPSPLSWGWRNPVILIDPDTMAEAHEAEAILAHEVAHVARRDWPALMVARLAAALFWFNPLVWLLEREVVQQAEEAADCEAALCVEPAFYARTLLTLAQVNGRLIPAHSIAPKGGALARRVRAILDRRLRERPSGSKWTAIASILCIGIAAPVAALQLVQAAQAQEAPVAPEAPQPPEAPRAPEAPRPPHVPHAPLPPQALSAPAPVAEIGDVPDVGPAVQQALAEVLPQIPQIVAQASSEAIAAIDPDEIQRSVDEALASAGPEIRHMSREDRERVRREVRRAVDQARVQARMVRIDRRQIEMTVRQAQRSAAMAPRAVAISMAHGAVGMARGADGMEAGAHRMEEQAAHFRDRSYREQIIAREAARGHNVTHEQLIEAAHGLEEGARGMRDGAREMRQAAQRMGEGNDRSD
jgi:beta-lactamase regulating signal transducer with metallopeptidase domain